MKLFCGVLLFIGVYTLSNASSITTLKRIATDQLLMTQLIQSRAGNPSYILPCFDIYIPIYEAILQEFNTTYLECNNVATTQRTELDGEAKGTESLISAAARDVCSSMIECSALDESLPFLDCYSQVGDTNIRTLYILTNNASDVAANLREEYRIVQNNLFRCQNASERAYVESTAKTTEVLNYCLVNGPPEIVTTTVEPNTITEEPAAGFEERDLSRRAPVAPQLLTLNRYKRLNRRALN